MATKQEKISLIGIKFGTTLLNMGINIAQSGFSLKVKPVRVNFATIKSYLLREGLSPTTTQYDSLYYLTSWDIWKLMIDHTLLDALIYLSDKFDCDNFAWLFSALSSALLGVNSCGAAFGKLYNNETGAYIGAHYFNVIVTSNGDLYCYEPMNDKSVLIKKGEPIIMGNWKYKIIKITFF